MSRKGVQGFQCSRLSQIIEVRRQTQAQLAAMVGVSTGTMSKWVNGTQAPEREALERLAQVLNVSPEWFTRPTLTEISSPLYRSNASAHAVARRMLKARLEWVQDITVAMEEFVDFPDLNLPELHFGSLEEITYADIEQAACDCRDRWRLGRAPIQDLVLAAESAGIIVVREDSGVAQIEGLSAWSSLLNRPLIFLSADKDNGFRSRFDLAHEIGHLILHRHINTPLNHAELEHQAHYFAGALLLPAESFSLDVQIPSTLDDLLMLKHRWGVSVAAIIMRLRTLDLIDEDGKRNLFKRLSSRWGRKSEPGDNARKPEQPRLLQRTVELLVDEKIMPPESIPRYLGLADIDVASITALPLNYFRPENKVLQLSTLKAATRAKSDDRLLSHENSTASKILPFKTNKS